MCRPQAVGLAFAVVGLLVWTGKNRRLKYREGGGVLALGGRRLVGKPNNQPKVGGSVRGDDRGEARGAESGGEGVGISFGVGK